MSKLKVTVTPVNVVAADSRLKDTPETLSQTNQLVDFILGSRDEINEQFKTLKTKGESICLAIDLTTSTGWDFAEKVTGNKALVEEYGSKDGAMFFPVTRECVCEIMGKLDPVLSNDIKNKDTEGKIMMVAVSDLSGIALI